MKEEKEQFYMEKIIELFKNAKDDGTVLDSVYTLYLLMGVAKGLDEARNGKGMTLEESRERVMQKYASYSNRHNS